MNKQTTEILEEIRTACPELDEWYLYAKNIGDPQRTKLPEPHIGHLLRAMENIRSDKLWMLELDGTLNAQDMNDGSPIEITKIDLTADLTQQLETNTELREFVHGLLVTKEK